MSGVCVYGGDEGEISSEGNLHRHCSEMITGRPQFSSPQKDSLFFFLPLNVPVAFLKVPRDARGCGEAA